MNGSTPSFGYGFYTAADNRAGAALDVISTSTFGADLAYAHWPVRYPAPEQQGVPAAIYPITLNWRYFGPAPVVTTSQLTAAGAPIDHTTTTELPVEHKGIIILPDDPLPASTTITVNVSGTYDGAPFSFTWSFHTAPTTSPKNQSPAHLPLPAATHSPTTRSLANSQTRLLAYSPTRP
jgi:hypothetical protein